MSEAFLFITASHAKALSVVLPWSSCASWLDINTKLLNFLSVVATCIQQSRPTWWRSELWQQNAAVIGVEKDHFRIFFYFFIRLSVTVSNGFQNIPPSQIFQVRDGKHLVNRISDWVVAGYLLLAVSWFTASFPDSWDVRPVLPLAVGSGRKEQLWNGQFTCPPCGTKMFLTVVADCQAAAHHLIRNFPGTRPAFLCLHVCW